MTKTRDLADLGGGFIQAGTGAVQRTVESKLQDVVSVKDFGAVGDGVVDDTAAIQAALDSGARKVCLVAGTYKVTSQLTIPALVTFIGDGIDASTVTVPATGSFNVVRPLTGSTVAGMTIDLANQSSSSAILIDGTGVERVTVDTVKATRGGFHGIAITNGAHHNSILNCTTSYNGHRGLILSNTYGNRVYNLYTHNNDLAGLLLYKSSNNLVDGVLAESINNNAVWCHMESYGNIIKNVVTKSPTDVTAAGLYVAGNAYNNVFSNFSIFGSDRSVLVRGSSVDAGLVNGNTRNNSFSLFHIVGNGSGVSGSAGVKFESASGGYKAQNNRFIGFVISGVENGFTFTNSGSADCDTNYIADCQAVNDVTNPWRFGTTTPGAGANRIATFDGYTPTGSHAVDGSQPAIPANGVAVPNPYPYPVLINIAGLTGNYQINGVNSGLANGLSDYTLVLSVGQTITLSYSSGTPTWRWFGLS